MTKTERRVVRAAMQESRFDVAQEGQFVYLGDESKRMKHLAEFCEPFRARRLRACAALARAEAKRRRK